MRQVWSGKTKLLSFAGGGVILASLGLALAGEYDTVLAWWVAIALLLPPLLWALKTRYTALVTICSIAFATQFVTLPFFYLNRDKFAWGHVKPFGFTALEAFPMLAKVSFFLLAMVMFFRWFYRISFVGGSPHNLKVRLPQSWLFEISTKKNQGAIVALKPHHNAQLFVLFIIAIITAMVPLHFWMFSQGISLVGVEPPNLPYKISGFLHYFTKYIIPLVLGYLYLKTGRGFFPMVLLLTYAWILGLSSVSRSALVLVMLPVLALAWLDCRRLLLLVAGLGTLLGFSTVSLARAFVHIVVGGKSGAVTESGIGAILFEIINDPSSQLMDVDFLFLGLVGVFDRVDGFSNLVMSQYYNPNEVIGVFGFILRMISRKLAPFDLDLHHIQWQGNVLPEGFVNGGALLSNAVIVGNEGLWWVLIGAMVTALTLVILEKSTERLFMRYRASGLIGTGVISFLCMTYFIETGGSEIFVYPFIMIFIASWLPPLFRLDGKRRTKPKIYGSSQVTIPSQVKWGATASSTP